MPTRDYGIADLLLRRGQTEGGRLRDLAQMQGQASQQNARIYALDREASAGRASDLVRSLALIGTKFAGDWQEQKQNEAVNAQKQRALEQQAERDRVAEARAMLQEERAGAAEDRAQQTFDQGQEKAATAKRQTTLLSDFYRRSFDPETQKIRPEVLNGFLMNAGMGEAAPAIFEGISKAEASNDAAKKARLALEQSQMEYGKTVAQQLDAARDPKTGQISPVVADGVLTMVESHGHTEEAKRFRQMWEQQPAQFDAFVRNLAQGTPTRAEQMAEKKYQDDLPARPDPVTGITPQQKIQNELERARIAQAAANAAKTAGGKKMLSSDANRISDIKDSLGLLTHLETQAVGGTGTIEWLGTKLPAWVTETTGIGLGPKERQATIALVKQVIGKTLEGGVLRKEDEIKYKDILPTIIDPEDVVRTKIAGLKTQMALKGNDLLESLGDAGFDVGLSQQRFGQNPNRIDVPAKMNVKVDGGSVPSNVSQALKNQGPGIHTLSDGSVWIKGPDGSIKGGG